jgi:hypothetical protein
VYGRIHALGDFKRFDRRTLTRWKKRPDFQTQIERHRGVWKQEREAQSVARRKACFASLDSLWKRLCKIVADRDRPPEMRNVPGGRTGFFYGRQKRFLSAGKVHVIADYCLDVTLLRAFRALEVQAARNLQQWGDPLENPDGSNAAASCCNCPPLSGKRELAAQLAGEDELSDAEIADCCGISRRMLSRWRWEPEFQARTEEYLFRGRFGDILAASMGRGMLSWVVPAGFILCWRARLNGNG